MKNKTRTRIYFLVFFFLKILTNNTTIITIKEIILLINNHHNIKSFILSWEYSPESAQANQILVVLCELNLLHQKLDIFSVSGCLFIDLILQADDLFFSTCKSELTEFKGTLLDIFFVVSIVDKDILDDFL